MMLRLLTSDDVRAIGRLEADAYLPSLHESDESFVRLIELFPAGALGCFDEDGLCGYAIGVPLTSGSTLELRVPLDRVPSGADTFYIHDVAVSTRGRGRGIGRLLAERLIEIGRAHGFTRFELVAVQGSAPFWERFGFRRVSEFEYAPGAPSFKMVRE